MAVVQETYTRRMSEELTMLMSRVPLNLDHRSTTKSKIYDLISVAVSMVERSHYNPIAFVYLIRFEKTREIDTLSGGKSTSNTNCRHPSPLPSAGNKISRSNCAYIIRVFKLIARFLFSFSFFSFLLLFVE